MHSEFVLTLSLSIVEHDTLWHAAATALAEMAPSLSDDDIADTIGPREAPNLADCLTTLLVPRAVPGSVIHRVSCRPVTVVDTNGTGTDDVDTIGFGATDHLDEKAQTSRRRIDGCSCWTAGSASVCAIHL